jgi:LysM repeat protein
MVMLNDFRNKVSKAYGQFDKNYAKGFLPGGAQVDAKIGGSILAAQEAAPAILRGALGLGDGVDRSIDPRMESELIDAYKRAKAIGAPMVKYDHYDSSTPGGFGARHTFGDVSYSGFKTDEDGNVTGLKPHAYDTNKTVEQLTDEINNGILQPNGTRQPAPFYKRAERELARHQDGGIVYHDLNFSSPQTGAPSDSDMMSGILTPTPGRMAGEVDITVDNTAPPGPATNYAVQAGDTLSSIAAANNISVDELVRKNQIANPDLISIGRTLNF